MFEVGVDFHEYHIVKPFENFGGMQKSTCEITCEGTSEKFDRTS